MPRECAGKIRLEIDLVERNTGLGDGTRTAAMPHGLLFEALIASGLSDGNLDRIYSDAISVTTTPTDVDLAGSLASEIGAGTTTFVDLCLVVVRNTGTAGNVQVGGDANAVPLFIAVGHTIVIPPGAIWIWYAPTGVPVTAGTGDILQLAASTGTVPCSYIVAGRSA